MRIYFDANVVLDYLLNRPNFFRNAFEAVAACTEREYPMLISATIVPTIHHIAKKGSNLEEADAIVDKTLKLFSVVPVGYEILRHARTLPSKDYEDNVQIAAALSVGAQYIITRNIDDFRNSPVPALTPGQFLKYLGESHVR